MIIFKKVTENTRARTKLVKENWTIHVETSHRKHTSSDETQQTKKLRTYKKYGIATQIIEKRPRKHTFQGELQDSSARKRTKGKF